MPRHRRCAAQSHGAECRSDGAPRPAERVRWARRREGGRERMIQQTAPIPFAGNPLDRAANLRRDAGWLAELSGASEARYLPFWRLNVLVETAEATGLRWLDLAVRERLNEESPPLLLGVHE